MNILDSEEMPEVEGQMLAIDPLPAYALAHPTLPPHSRLPASTAPTYTRTELPPDHPLHRILPNTRNTISLREEDPNSTVKLFTYALLALLYPPSATDPHLPLLETVKCSLYSRDLDFNFSHHPRTKPIDNLQAKALLTRFLHTLTGSALSNQDRLRGGVAMLEGNAMLLELFAVFFRAILGKLDLEEAADHSCPLPFEPALGNLLEFFDIPHRHLPALFLLHEENYFLAAASGLFFGEYLENSSAKTKPEPSNQRPLQNNVQSKPNEQTHKKNGVFHNDIRLFNFLLQSGSQVGVGLTQKSKEIQTPHFSEAQEFAFGRSRRDLGQLQRQEELKREFEKLIMNCEQEPAQEELGRAENDSPATPVIGGAGGVTFTAFKSPQPEVLHFQREETEQGKPKPFLRKSTFNQSPLADQDPADTPKLNPEHHRNGKNIVSVKDKHVTTFSPQPHLASKLENFTSFANDAAFLDADPQGDYFKSSSGKVANITIPLLAGECRCGEMRKGRNKIISKVMEFIFNPKISSSGRSPRFLHNLKHSQNIINPPKIKVTPPKDQNPGRDADLPNTAKEQPQRIPTFLKSLRKDKDKDKYSASSKSKSKQKISVKEHSHSPSPSPAREAKRFEVDPDTMRKINNKFAKFSAILSSKGPLQSKAKQSKSTTRKNESSSLSRRVATELGGTIKRFDSRFINTRPGLGSTWKSSSNFHLPYPNIQKKPNQEGLGKRETMRVFPSTQHIPTAYLHTSNVRTRQPDSKETPTRESQVAGRVGSKLTQAHSSEKYKQFTQLAVVQPPQ